jgi:hypothetical protein
VKLKDLVKMKANLMELMAIMVMKKKVKKSLEKNLVKPV